MILSALLQTKGEASRLRSLRAPSSGKTRISKSGFAPTPAFSEDAENPQFRVGPEDPELQHLNDSLVLLAEIFPDVQVEVFRELLSGLGKESRAHLVTEALLKDKAKIVRGRWRLARNEEHRIPPSKTKDNKSPANNVPLTQRFRSPAYTSAVRAALYQEFRGLSNSAINAVLAENNYCYTLARPELARISTKSWRYSVASFFLQRRAPVSKSAEKHPLVIERPINHSLNAPVLPTLKYTSSPELNKELYESLIVPLLQKRKGDQEYADRALAVRMNDAQAEKYKAQQDCECCYTSTSFEQLSSCDSNAHFICFRCIRHAVNEALFGQGWARSIHMAKGSIRCFAPMSEECQACISPAFVHRALLEENGGEDLWMRLGERLAAENLLRSEVKIVRCPFCVYAEVDEIYLPATHSQWRFRRRLPSLPILFVFIIAFGMVPFLLPFLIVSTLLLPFHPSFPHLSTQLNNSILLSLARSRRHSIGLRFTCQNPSCLRFSCISCTKEWRDIHICYETERSALRAAVERAMAEAIKRTCPRCNISFVKASGCNKLTCLCGYRMCYLCRGEIGEESYAHFCPHFRPAGGACTQCEKCDLYRNENEDAVIRKAAEEAEKEWREREGVETAWRWEGREKTVGGSVDGQGMWYRRGWWEVFDEVVREFAVEAGRRNR